MSDYFENSFRYKKNYAIDFEKQIRQTRNDMNRFIENGKNLQQNCLNESWHNLLQYDTLTRGGQIFSERTECDPIQRLELLSSSLVQFLSTERQDAEQSYVSPCTFFVPTNNISSKQINSQEFRKRPTSKPKFSYQSFHSSLQMKREKHNIVERRRRSIINERISEIRNLLPEGIRRATLGRKISVLKEAIDYIKELQKELKLLQQLEEQLEDINRAVRSMSERLKKLEIQKETSVSTQGRQEVQNYGNQDIDGEEISHEYDYGYNNSISSFPQNFLQENTFASFETNDTRPRLSIDTTISFQTSRIQDFDALNCIASDVETETECSFI